MTVPLKFQKHLELVALIGRIFFSFYVGRLFVDTNLFFLSQKTLLSLIAWPVSEPEARDGADARGNAAHATRGDRAQPKAVERPGRASQPGIYVLKRLPTPY